MKLLVALVQLRLPKGKKVKKGEFYEVDGVDVVLHTSQKWARNATDEEIKAHGAQIEKQKIADKDAIVKTDLTKKGAK